MKPICTALMILCCSLAGAAEIDMVYRVGDSKGVGGEIKSVSKTEVVVFQKVGNKEEAVPVNEIDRVEWKAEPSTLSLARSNERSGNLSEAVTGFQEAMKTAEGDPLKGEIQFLLARTAYQIAQKDPAQLASAIDQLQKFVGDYRDHFRFYHAQLLLAETALQAGNTVAAEAAYSLLEQAPWQDYKMAGKVGNGRSLLAQNKVSEAKSIFDSVAAMNPKTDSEKGRQLEAILGQARCSQMSKNFEEATQTLQKVVDQTTPEDARLMAEAYLQLGECHAADGQKLKEAVLAYLHVDVIPTLAAESDLHAEALYHLSKLWVAIGQPARAAEASARLEQDYPQSPWTKKLAEGA